MRALSESLSSPSASVAAVGEFFAAGAAFGFGEAAAGVVTRLAGAEGCPAGAADADDGFGDCFTEAVDEAAVAGAAGLGVTAARVALAGGGAAATGAADTVLTAFPEGAPVRPIAGLPDDREGGVTATVEGNPRPPELNSSITSHFSSLTTISGFKSGRCRRILTSIFPPVFLRFVGSKSYKAQKGLHEYVVETRSVNRCLP